MTLDGLGDKYRNVDTSQNLESVKGRQGEAVGMEEEDKEEGVLLEIYVTQGSAHGGRRWSGPTITRA